MSIRHEVSGAESEKGRAAGLPFFYCPLQGISPHEANHSGSHPPRRTQ